jgi:hypothetical protein
MKRKAESVETTQVLGYLGSDDVLYCSPGCAAERGQADAQPVDRPEYDALLDRGSLSPVVVCPVCGSDFPLEVPAAGEPE